MTIHQVTTSHSDYPQQWPFVTDVCVFRLGFSSFMINIDYCISDAQTRAHARNAGTILCGILSIPPYYLSYSMSPLCRVLQVATVFYKQFMLTIIWQELFA